MKSAMDSLYEQLDSELESQVRQHALNRLILAHTKDHHILEVGCGSGTLLKLLLQKGYDAIGCDTSQLQCARTRKRLQKAGFSSKDRVFHLSLENTRKWKRRFDTVICIDVLEHIKDDTHALHSLFIRLAPRGRVLIVVPSLPQLWSQRDVIYGHYRRYTKTRLQTLLETTPLTIRTIRYWNFIGAIIAWPVYRIGLDLRLDHLGTRDYSFLHPFQRMIALWLERVECSHSIPFGMSLFAIAEKQ